MSAALGRKAKVTDSERVTEGLTASVSTTGTAADDADKLCLACVEFLGVDGAALSLLLGGVSQGTVGSSGLLATEIGEYQFTFGEGPSLEAVAAGAPVLVPDLEDPAEQRWPAFVDAVLGNGVRAVFALPVSLGSAPVGALDLYRRQRGGLSPVALAGALLAAQLASRQFQSMVESTDASVDLVSVQRIEVYQATGMIMDSAGLSSDDALTRLRSHAFVLGLAVSLVAWSIVDRRLMLAASGEWEALSGPSGVST